MKNEIQILLPALNEAEALPKVIGEIRTLPLSAEIIVADNGSTDGTGEIAQSMGARVINVPKRGKGNAIQEAVKHVDAEFIFMLDSDYTYPCWPICDMLILLRDKGYDAVVGERKAVSESAMKLYNKTCNASLNLLNHLIYGGKINDICSGMWGFRLEVLKNLNLTASSFELEADIFTRLYAGQYKLARIPIKYRERLGRSKIKFSDGFRIAGMLVKRSLR